MKSKTKSLLSVLLKKHSTSELIGLWADISPLSEQEFAAKLAEIGGGKPKSVKKPRNKKPKGPADDRPVTRIAHHLRSNLGFTDEHACRRLRAALVQFGVSSTRIPPIAGADLEHWLYELLGQVSDSTVMTIARNLKA